MIGATTKISPRPIWCLPFSIGHFDQPAAAVDLEFAAIAARKHEPKPRLLRHRTNATLDENRPKEIERPTEIEFSTRAQIFAEFQGSFLPTHSEIDELAVDDFDI